MASNESGKGGIECKKRSRSEGKDVSKRAALPQYGNYRGYYSIRREGARDTEQQDPRLTALLAWLRKDENGRLGGEASLRRALDIGCNSGQFTLQLCEALEKSLEVVIGVDVDGELLRVATAAAKRRVAKLLQDEDGGHLSSNMYMPRVLGQGRVVRRGSSAPRQRLRLDSTTGAESSSGPVVTRFLHSEWVFNSQLARSRGDECPSNMPRTQWLDMVEVDREDTKGYQLILALSVTKWVHLHHFDSGLRHFFARVASCLVSGGIFVLEPQGFKSYKNSLKVIASDSQAYRNFHALRVMPDDFAWILCHELGFEGPYQVREKGKDASIRRIDAYVQPPEWTLPPHCVARRASLLALCCEQDPLTHDRDTVPWVSRSRESCV